MEAAFFVSLGAVFLGEMGDKTQLLALVLAARFRRPWPIIAGIFVATLINHTVAGWVGGWIRHTFSPDVLRWGLGLSFLAVAAWALKPDKLQDDEAKSNPRLGVFAVTVLSFFIAEIGDKTQVATVMLAAKYPSLVAVVAGTTCGMLLADVPVVFLGRAAGVKLPLRALRIATAVLFTLLGAASLWGVGWGG